MNFEHGELSDNLFNVPSVCVTYIRFAPDLNKTRRDLVHTLWNFIHKKESIREFVKP